MKIILQAIDNLVFPFYLLNISALIQVRYGECNMLGVDTLEIKRGKQ